jgi:hypothetical protein
VVGEDHYATARAVQGTPALQERILLADLNMDELA